MDPADLNSAAIDPADLNLATMNPATTDSIILNPATTDPADLNSTATDPAELNPATTETTALNSTTMNPVGLGSVKSLGMNYWDKGTATPRVLERIKERCKRWSCVATAMTVLVVVVTVALIMGLTTTNTAQPTTALPLTLAAQHEQQQQRVGALAGCRLVVESVKVMDEVLVRNETDDLLQHTLLTHNIDATRCRGLCFGYGQCQPMHRKYSPFLVKYMDGNGTIQYTERQVLNHSLCQCLHP